MATINDLPNELLLHIFSYLRWRLKSLSRVCHRWDALIVPDLELCVWRNDDRDRREATFRSLFRRSSRQYERLGFAFEGRADLGDRASLWALERFPYARDVYMSFDKNNLKRILMYLDALEPNVQRLTLFLDRAYDFGKDTDHSDEETISGKGGRAPHLRHVVLINLSKSMADPICNWLRRNAPNIENLEYSNSNPADIIQLYAGHLRNLKVSYLFSTGESIHHIKCPKLTRFSFDSEKVIRATELDAFIRNAPQLRYFELRSDSPCQNAVRALTNLPNLEVLKLQPSKEVITFEEHDKFPALRTLSLHCPITDVPQLPIVQKLIILQPTSNQFYPRMIFRAPNLTCLHVEKDTFLNNESIVSICTGLTQLTDLRLKIHPSVQITLKAFISIHLLHQLQRFYIGIEDMSKYKWLGAWFKKLKAPAVTIVNEQCFITMPLKNLNLLLANLRTRVLTLRRIAFAELHITGGSANVRREVARLRPDLQFHYVDPVAPRRWW